MESLGFEIQMNATLDNLGLDTLKSAEIEGEIFDPAMVRSSLARRLGITIENYVHAGDKVEGMTGMMVDASQNYSDPLSVDRLFSWHNSLFPSGKSGMYRIRTGDWRDDSAGPMQVVSGAMGKERVHFQAPEAGRVPYEMERFLQWFNSDNIKDLVLKAAIAHIWFLTIHPFEDGNGRIARALTDMLLARADKTHLRFYSMSSRIRAGRNSYYNQLEKHQKGDLEVTGWINWFLETLKESILASEKTMSDVMFKTHFWQKNKLTPLNKRQIMMINRMLDGFEGKLTSQKWAKITGCSADTALRDINDLIGKNILEKDEPGGRSTGYLLISKNESV
jgi:Fic family protein